MFTKVGQYPPLSIEPSAELSKALGEEDTALYKKALVNGNYAFGIGALAYFRRVIENKVNLLLDLIGEAAELANFETEELQRIDEIKESPSCGRKDRICLKNLTFTSSTRRA